MLKTRGFNHIDLGTRNMEATRAFYQDVLGFPLVRADLIDIAGKGTMKHFFFDLGHGQLIGFMSGEEVQGFPEFDAGTTRASACRRASTTSPSTPRPRTISSASRPTSFRTGSR